MKQRLNRLKDFLMNGIHIFTECNMSVYAGYATLFIVTAVFPLIMLIVAVVNLLPGYSAKDVADLLIQILPDLDPIRELTSSIINNLKDQSGGLLASVAAVTTLWSASKGVSAIQKGLNQLNPKEANKGIKGIVKRLLFTLLLVILIPALLIFEMLDKSIKNVIFNSLEKMNLSNLESIKSTTDTIFSISSVAVLIFALLVVLLIYAVLPSVRKTLKSQLPGALCTMVCWVAFTKLFSYFIPKFFNFSALYGSLAALFLALLWLRYMVIILFGGGVLNKTIEEHKTAKSNALECNSELPGDPADVIDELPGDSADVIDELPDDTANVTDELPDDSAKQINQTTTEPTKGAKN